MSVLINRKYINKEYITQISNELVIQKIHSKQTKFNDLNNNENKTELYYVFIKNGEKIIVDFYTDWCGPCKMMKPIFERVSKQFRDENSDVQLYTMNAEKNSEISSMYGVRAVPTIKTFNNGNVIESKTGVLMEMQIKELASNLLN